MSLFKYLYNIYIYYLYLATFSINIIFVYFFSIRNSTHDGDRRKGSFALEELLKIKDENSGWFKF